MNVLIIGGARFIGPYVVKKLIEQGNDVTVFHRGKSKTPLPDGVTHIYGDRKDLNEFKSQIEKGRPDVVVDMIPITEHQAKTLVAVFRGITNRIIAISSQDVYRAYGVLLGKEKGIEEQPSRENSPLREKLYPYRGDEPRADDDPRKILDDYDKIPIEKIIMNSPGIKGTVLRLPMVYGPNDYQHRLFEHLKRMDDNRPAIIVPAKLAQWRTSRGYVENVAYGIALAITDDKSVNRIYNVAEPDDFTEADWIRHIAQVAGWNGKVVIVPEEKLPSEYAADFNADQHLTADTTRIRTELGYREQIPLEKALASTIEWERNNPPPVQAAQFDYKKEDEILQSLGFHQ
ncbi:MAG: NAD-dependent epimerase/dehydratase family protein [candidate division WOR-3 bacterium]|nr:MAG: NAD-dependent epimerase/dehydratase family protein [candidate division WOR-3 bacterium]